MLDYASDGPPTDADREQVEAALRDLERAYEWSCEGLLSRAQYSPAYFDRFEADVAGVDLPEPTALDPSWWTKSSKSPHRDTSRAMTSGRSPPRKRRRATETR